MFPVSIQTIVNATHPPFRHVSMRYLPTRRTSHQDQHRTGNHDPHAPSALHAGDGVGWQSGQILFAV
ncbi:MAG: hypothetical protein RBT80_17170 [Candidatus Vecturithrix sp.]|nr:hypothetical protein [Candidatus Vecturithrix sp.]